MQGQITVEVRSVYGAPTIYPVCKQAELFAKLAKKKTLSAEDLEVIMALGFEVVEQCLPKLRGIAS